jgi:hypothetical protein
MKLKFLCITAFILLLISNVYAIFSSEYWLVNVNNILLIIFAVVLFHKKYKKFNRNFFIFLGASGVSFFMRIFEGDWVCKESSLLLLTIAYLALIVEALKFTKVKNASNLMLAYFFLVVGVNGYLLSMHVLEMKDYLENSLVYAIYIIYYINLLILGITALTYYLNSYSRKSVYFIALVLALIFAEVLRDMGIFYLRDPSVEVAEGILRMGVAIFVVLFFVTKEKKLLLVNFL